MFLIILTVIRFNLTSAENQLTLIFPDTVHVSEEFEVSVDSTSNKTSDIKIYIHNSSDEKITRSEVLSQILDSTWKDSWLYVSSIFPSEKTFKLKADTYSSTSEICLQIRQVNKTTYDKICLPINLFPSSSQELNQEIQQENTFLIKSNNKSTNKKHQGLIYTDNSISTPSHSIVSTDTSENDNPIHFHSNNSQQFEFYTKEHYYEKTILYSFIIISVLALFLMFRKKI